MSFQNSETFKQEKMEETANKAAKLNHVYIQGFYESKSSKLKIYCPLHNFETETTFSNYLRSPNGLKCCGKASKSKLLTGREFSKETIKKMSNSALSRRVASRESFSPKDWRRCREYSTWERQVTDIWNFDKNMKCILINQENPVYHHFYSGSYLNSASRLNKTETIRYDPINGITISKDLHIKFHNKYGYLDNTIDQLIEFIKENDSLILG